MGISFLVIYFLFSEYREEGFQQQQNEKILTTIKLIERFQKESATISSLIDQQDINDFYDEKLLIYDVHKKLIFASLDSLDIIKSENIIHKLSPQQKWIETKEADYDLVGIYTEVNQHGYYAVSKAYDAQGYAKIYFLRNVLLGLFVFIIIVVVFISRLLSNMISKPITQLADKLNKFDLSEEKVEELPIENSSFELNQLTHRFNTLIQRTNAAFLFQKHTIHHISHQLKTPISVLVVELERIKNLPSKERIQEEINHQIIKTKSLGRIIQVLLEFSKIESGQQVKKEEIRIDELFFDAIEELGYLYPDFSFAMQYFPAEIREDNLIVEVDPMLFKQAILNLLSNCVAYSNEPRAEISMHCARADYLIIQIKNSGMPISDEEEKLLFHRFFRGKNSEGRIGFGLGLVLTKRILELHNVQILYINPQVNVNIFELRLPLS